MRLFQVGAIFTALYLLVMIVGCGGITTTASQNAKIAQYEQAVDALEQEIRSLKSQLSSCETSYEKYQTEKEIDKLEKDKIRYEYYLHIIEQGERTGNKKE